MVAYIGNRLRGKTCGLIELMPMVTRVFSKCPILFLVDLVG